jgi:tetratricopeptide (TPR) repeat protein
MNAVSHQFSRPLRRTNAANLKTVRTLAVGAALLLTASAVHSQGKESRGGRDHFVYPQNTTDSHGVFASTYELRTAITPEAVPPVGIISARDLQVPAKATKEFDRSMKAFQSNDYLSAANHLEKAVRIAPDFVQAHNNLGAMYINLKRYENAVVELQKTIDLNPNVEAPYHNLGMVLILLGRLPDAEAAARHALDLSPQRAATLYTLGRILALEGHYTPEAVSLLSQAAVDTPEANLVLAKVLQNRGERVGAAAALRVYLQSADVAKSDPKKRAPIQAWLAQLTNTATATSQSKPAAPAPSAPGETLRP